MTLRPAAGPAKILLPAQAYPDPPGVASGRDGEAEAVASLRAAIGHRQPRRALQVACLRNAAPHDFH